MARHRRRSRLAGAVAVATRAPERAGLVAVGGVAAAITLSMLLPTVGSVDSALAGPELAAEPTVPATSTSRPGAEWLAAQSPPNTTTSMPPVTTSTAPDPMAGYARYDVRVGSFAGPAWRLTDVEPGRVGRAVLTCACHPEEVALGDPVVIDGRVWEAFRSGSSSVADLAREFFGAPLAPVVMVVSSFDGATRTWLEAR